MAEHPQNIKKVDESIADIMIVSFIILCLFSLMIVIGIF